MEIDIKIKIAAFLLGLLLAIYQLYRLKRNGSLDNEKRVADHKTYLQGKGERSLTFTLQDTWSMKAIKIYFVLAVVAVLALIFFG